MEAFTKQIHSLTSLFEPIEFWRFYRLIQKITEDGVRKKSSTVDPTSPDFGKVEMTYKELGKLWNSDLNSVFRQLTKWERNGELIRYETPTKPRQPRVRKHDIFIKDFGRFNGFLMTNSRQNPDESLTNLRQNPDETLTKPRQIEQRSIDTHAGKNKELKNEETIIKNKEINFLEERPAAPTSEPLVTCGDLSELFGNDAIPTKDVIPTKDAGVEKKLMPLVVRELADGSFETARRECLHVQPPDDSEEFNKELHAWAISVLTFLEGYALDNRIRKPVTISEDPKQAGIEIKVMKAKIKNYGLGELSYGTGIMLAVTHLAVEKYADNQSFEYLFPSFGNLLSNKKIDNLVESLGEELERENLECYGLSGKSGHDFKTETKAYLIDARKRKEIRDRIKETFKQTGHLPPNWRKFFSGREQRDVLEYTWDWPKYKQDLPEENERILRNQMVGSNFKHEM